MTIEEIKYKIETDPSFAIQFAIDNNPDAVLRELAIRGYYSETSPEYAKAILMGLLSAGKTEEIKDIFKSIPYNDNATNYTSGMKDYFYSDGQKSTVISSEMGRAAGFSLDAFLGALGSGLTTYSALSGTGGVISSGGPVGQNQPSWLQRNWLWLLLGLVVIAFIIIMIKKLKKK